jgi:hypothetical protein
MWRSSTDVDKDNVAFLAAKFGIPSKVGPKSQLKKEAPKRCHGALFTWQTSHGRLRDNLHHLGCLQVSVETQTDLCQHDNVLIVEFNSFVSWLSALAAKLGFHLWTACMELNTNPASKNKLHLHAFVCKHWKHWKQNDAFEPVEILPGEWSWQGFLPHVHVTQLRGNANPQRSFVAGLYYQEAPKLGSIFRDGNCKAFKDPCSVAKWVEKQQRRRGPGTCDHPWSLSRAGGGTLGGLAERGARECFSQPGVPLSHRQAPGRKGKRTLWDRSSFQMSPCAWQVATRGLAAKRLLCDSRLPRR